MSTDIIKCQKKYIFFKNLKSKQCEGAGGWGPGWGCLDSFYVQLGILFLFVSTLICASWFFFLEHYYSHQYKTFLKKSSSCSLFEKLSPFEDSLLPPGVTSEMLQRKLDILKGNQSWKPRMRWEHLWLSLFLLSVQNQDCLALKLIAHKPKSGMYAYCASIYTLIS